MSIDLGRLRETALAVAWRRHALDFGVRLAALLYPRLRERPAGEWRMLLRQARDEPFEAWEILVILGGMAFATWLLRVERSILAEFSIVIVALVQFVLALPALGVTVGPVHVRRTRRGLERLLAGSRCPPTFATSAPAADTDSSRKEK
ncbi:MAG: hypothetical protein ABI831_01040 [Betaproteobacteria bacterium]